MQYIMLPNSFNEIEINKRFSNEEFLNLQIKYRKIIENRLLQSINFEELDEKIKKVIVIPKIKDNLYNFYHRYSKLGSDYIYLRNNFHIERLTDEEIKELSSGKCGDDFIVKTMARVMFEEGDYSFFGNSIPEYAGKSKSIVFEFAYDQMKLTSLEEISIIEELIKEINNYLETKIRQNINVPVSFITYNGICDVYKTEEFKPIILPD